MGQRGRDEKIEIHLGSIKTTCHTKKYGLGEEFWVHRQRTVLRGDLVKDKTGHHALSTKQRNSASYMADVKLLHVVVRLHECDGEDADATSAFDQITLDEAARSS